MTSNPIHQDAEICDLKTALERLELLRKNIMRLKGDIPKMTRRLQTVKGYLKSIYADTNIALEMVELLIEQQQTWEQWLRGRLTLLANLKTFLQLNDLDNQQPEGGKKDVTE